MPANKRPATAKGGTGGDVQALLDSATVVNQNGQADRDRDEVTEQTLRERETERLGVQKYYELRDKWSRYIMLYVWFMLAFQLFLTMAIGLRWIDFNGYSVFLNLIIGQNFAQIVGMGIIVAKFLFSDKKPG